MSRKNLGAEYTRALNALEHAEKKMTRAFNAWVKSRQRLKSLDKRAALIQRELDSMEVGR